jgi:hypothetical protein
MDERMFPSGDWPADDAHATVRVCDLAESLLDEISEPLHVWPALSARTRELHRVASTMAERYPREPRLLDDE